MEQFRRIKDVPVVFCVVVPSGVVTVMVFTSWASTLHSILYPAGRNVLNPCMSSGLPAKRDDTLSMTPGVSILRGQVSQAIGEDVAWLTFDS